MSRRNTRYWLAVFFCSTGLVYTGPANADEGMDALMAEAAASPTPMPDSAAPAPGSAPATPMAAAPAEPLFEEAPAEAPLPQGQQVNVGSFGEIDLHVKDLDLTKVLQLLSIQSQRNIIASKNVAGAVSADLYGVDFYQALDAILHPNGFGYEERGQFIYVYTQDELAARQEAQRKLSTKIVRLDYISAADATAFLTPLLSDRGSISVSGEPNAGIQPTIGDAGANSFAHADTLVIRDYEENIAEILSVIEELDVRPKQVMVEATVLQAQLTETNAWGVDLNVLIDYDFADFAGSPVDVIDDLVTGGVAGGDANTPPITVIGQGGGAQTGVGNTTQAGGFKVGILTDNVSAFVRALDNVTDTTVLANPKLLVLNRQKADLLVGQELGYLSTTQTETSSTQTVEFLEIGTQLSVRPFVSSDDMIRLELRPELSDGSTSVQNGMVIPNKTTQQLVTNVMVKSAQTVVLGGLFMEDTEIGRRQVPGLGDVPILGAAFKGQDDDVTRTEVIFLIKPTIMKDESLYAAGEEAREGIELAALGARRGLLPWSKAKLTTNYVREAVEYAEAGNTDKALWYTNLALHLDPTMVEALRLKQELTGEQFYYLKPSILEHAIDATINAQIEELGATKPAAPAGDAEAEAEAEADEHAANAAADIEQALDEQIEADAAGAMTGVEVDDAF